MASVGDRIREVMKKLDVESASELGRRAGIPGQTITNILRSADKDPNYTPRRTTLESIAKPLGVSVVWLEHGIEGHISTDLTLEHEPEHIPADDEVPQETALFRVYVTAPKGRYTTGDFDAARGAIRGVDRKALPDGDHDAHAAQLLDAARSLRQLGVPATVPNVMARALGARTEREAAADEAFNAESDEIAREHGIEPGQGRAALEAMRAKKGRRG